ncbi:hypothetical protein GobsT_71550 [Gemmata obscuriglobus]|uniref:Uncharacterized protein n=1 Tax=Gemmata obscuriglobus TaxID=114 RepID=A0A2Z3HDS5_9BACT|nr:hypothetical protein [Gemmata obscuriglobus]AWM41747.1 hypothetical protein C1280_35285 [Gemmata obscuriglobus]QEG32302.1 hypothetical protein GobsT_71550 [Gemmata obscuriglobus]VTS11658.1 unnamed protein product [Gemmata obscuriglobus UQM 2246]
MMLTVAALPAPDAQSRKALWEITAIEFRTQHTFTFFAVTLSASEPPDTDAAWRAVRGGDNPGAIAVHSVRRVSRIRTAETAGRLAGTVFCDVVADLRPRAVAPARLGYDA